MTKSVRYCRTYSDSSIASYWLRSSIYKEIREILGSKNKSWRSLQLKLIGDSFSFFTEVGAFSTRVLLRFNEGRFGGHGWILFIFTLAVMLLWNQEKSINGYFDLFKSVFDILWAALSGQ